MDPEGVWKEFTSDGQRHGLGISNRRRLYRAVPVESLTSYVTYQNEHISHIRASVTRIDELSRDDRRMLKFNHMAHQMWRAPKSTAIDILGKLDIDPKGVVDLYDPQILEAVNELEFPENVTRSPFMELTNACPDDQALAYQHAVMKELAKRAYEMDHSFEMPQSTLL
eukprot:5694385-Amphidinium_carterae.1